MKFISFHQTELMTPADITQSPERIRGFQPFHLYTWVFFMSSFAPATTAVTIPHRAMLRVTHATLIAWIFPPVSCLRMQRHGNQRWFESLGAVCHYPPYWLSCDLVDLCWVWCILYYALQEFVSMVLLHCALEGLISLVWTDKFLFLPLLPWPWGKQNTHSF